MENHQVTESTTNVQTWTWEIVPERGLFAPLGFLVLMCFEAAFARLIPEGEWSFTIPLGEGAEAQMTLEPGTDDHGCTTKIACPAGRVERMNELLGTAIRQAAVLLESQKAEGEEIGHVMQEFVEAFETRHPGVLDISMQKLPRT